MELNSSLEYSTEDDCLRRGRKSPN
jgi:hypothetical protein